MKNSLGLPEFEISNPREDAEGRSIMYDAVKIGNPDFCTKCMSDGPFYRHGWSKKPRIVQDLSAHGKLIYLNLKPRRWRCRLPECGKAFTETFWSIDGKEQMTIRLKEHIQKRGAFEKFSHIARELSISEGTVRRLFNLMTKEREPELQYKAPRVLGLDEAHLDGDMRAVIVDAENKRLLDVLPNRDTEYLVDFFKRMNGIEHVSIITIDMYPPYRALIKKHLPWVHIVVDHFHVIQDANRKVDEVRFQLRRNFISLYSRLKKKQKEEGLTDKEKKTFQFSKDSVTRMRGIAKTLKTNREDMTPVQRAWLMYVFQFHPELKIAFYLKEGIRRIYRSKTRREAALIYITWKKNIPESDYFDPFRTLADTIDKWARDIFNFFTYGFTNAYAENRNGFIKTVQEDCRSLSFEQLRYKVLFASNAVKMPKFLKRKAEWFESAHFGHMMSAYNATVEELVEGRYVDIDEYVNNCNRTVKVKVVQVRRRRN